MSIRVNNHEVGLTSKTGAAGAIKPAGSGRSTDATGRTDEDQLDVSPLAESINNAVNAQNVSRADRIAQLGKLVAAGQYSVPAVEISRTLVAGAAGGQ